MRHPELVQGQHRPPEPLDQVVADLVLSERPEAPAGALGDQHGVALGRHARGDDRQDRDAPALREQRHERLVLHLPETTEPEAGPFATVPQGCPEGREELAVPCVSPVHLDQELLPVGRDGLDQGDARRFQRRVSQVGRFHAQIAQRRRDLLERQTSRRGAEHEVQDRPRPEADQEPGHHPDGQRDAERDAGDRADRHDPPAEESDRAAHVRRGHHDDGRGDRQADRQVHRRRVRRPDALQARGPVGACDLARDQGQSERQGARHQFRQEQPFAPFREEREEQQEERPPEQQVERDLPEPPEEPRELRHEVRDGPVDRGGTGREERQDDDPEQRDDQQDDVGGTPGTRCVARRREDAHIDMTQRARIELGQAAALAMRFGRSALRRRLRRSHLPPSAPRWRRLAVGRPPVHRRTCGRVAPQVHERRRCRRRGGARCR